jgi:hypothetical protein
VRTRGGWGGQGEVQGEKETGVEQRLAPPGDTPWGLGRPTTAITHKHFPQTTQIQN